MVETVTITKQGFQCKRCLWQWVPRDINSEPRVCPTCKSPYWNRERRQAQERKP